MNLRMKVDREKHPENLAHRINILLQLEERVVLYVRTYGETQRNDRQNTEKAIQKKHLCQLPPTSEMTGIKEVRGIRKVIANM